MSHPEATHSDQNHVSSVTTAETPQNNPGGQMSDRVETVIAEHRPYGLDCKCGRPINSDADWAYHLLAALKAARIAVVELPEPDKYERFWYGNHCNYTFVDTGEVETSRVYQRIDPPTLREYVAALLAAADAAESAAVGARITVEEA